jgi:arginyl-tRNA synthetase
MDDSVETRLQELHMDQPDLLGCFPSFNPFDVYRIDIANAIYKLSGVQPKTTFSILQRTSTLDKGDLLLPVPALRIKGEKPEMLANRCVDQVIIPVAQEPKKIPAK